MLPLILLGAVALTGTLIAVYWKKIVKWLKAAYDFLPEDIKKKVKGFITLVKSVGSLFKNIVKYYSYNKDTGKWKQTILTQEVDESEIPAEILAKVKKSPTQEVDTSEELRQKMELTV